MSRFTEKTSITSGRFSSEGANVPTRSSRFSSASSTAPTSSRFTQRDTQPVQEAPQLDPLGNPIPTVQAYEPSIGEKVEQFGRDAGDFVAAMSIQNPTLNFLDFLEGDTNQEIVEEPDGSLAFGEVPEPTNEERLKARGIDPESGLAIGAKIVSEIIDPPTMALGLAKAPVALGAVGKTVFGGVQASTAVGAAETSRQLGSEGQVTDAGKIFNDMAWAFGIGSGIQGTLEGGRGLVSSLADTRAAKVAEFETAAIEVSDLARDKIQEGAALSDAFREAASELGYAKGAAVVKPRLKIVGGEGGKPRVAYTTVDNAKARVQQAAPKGANARRIAMKAADNLGDLGDSRILKEAVEDDLFLRGSAAGHGARTVARAALKPFHMLDKDGGIKRGADNLLGAVSTRIRNLDENTFKVMRKMDKEEARTIQGYGLRVKPWVDRMREVRKSSPLLAKRIDEALDNSNLDAADSLMIQAGIPKSTWDDVKTVLGEHKGYRQQYGLMEEGVEEFFPRVVDDIDGLRGMGGKEVLSRIDKKLKTAADAQGGRPLSELQVSHIISRAIRESNKSSTVGANAGKSRTVNEVSFDMLKYYKNAEDALDSYIRNSSRDIVGRKYFGGGKVVGELSEAVERAKDGLNARQIDDLEGLVHSRASGAMLQGGQMSRGLKDLSYLITVADPVNALIQMSDIPLAAYKNGIIPTIRGVSESIAVGRRMKGLEKLSKTDPDLTAPIYRALLDGKSGEAVSLGNAAGLKLEPLRDSLDVIDLGMANNIAADMTQDAGAMARAVHNAFKFSGFSKLDRFGKRVHMNGSKNKLKKIARMSDEAAKAKMVKLYGDSYNLDEALASIRAGEFRNDAVTDLIWHDLLDMQPVSLSELPQFYLDHPEWRIAYTLKSFGLKQLDILRRDVVHELMNKQVGPATKSAMALAAAVTLGTGSYRAGRDLFFTGEVEDPHHYAIEALLGFAFASQYTVDQLGKGDLRGVAAGTILPASLDFLGALVEDSVNLVKGDPTYESLEYVPFVKNIPKYQEGH